MENGSVTTDEELEVIYPSIIDDVFQNSVVVGTLLRLLPVKDVLGLRLVNRFFNDISCSVLNMIRTETKRLWTKELMQNFLLTYTNRDLISGFPFTTIFELEVWDIPLDLVQKFAELLGPSVTGYKIWFFKNSGFVTPTASELDNHQVEVKVGALLSTCPRLEKLDLADKCINLRWEKLQDMQENMHFPNLRHLGTQGFCTWKEEEGGLTAFVARRAPALDHVTLILVRNRIDHTMRCLNFLPEFLYEVCRKLPQLTLVISLCDPDNISLMLDQLTSRNFNRFVSLRFQGTQGGLEFLHSLHNLLELQSETLEDLEMSLHLPFNKADPHNYRLRLPHLKKLKTLRMTVRGFAIGFSDVGLKVCPLETGQFPLLKTLEFGLYKRTFGWVTQGFTASTLESLTVSRYSGSAENETFHLNFPNLKTLKVFGYDSDSLLEYVLRRMTSLETLSMGHSNGTGTPVGTEMWDIYTGGANLVSDEELVKMDKLPIGEGLPTENISTITTVASLGNFKALKKLELTVTNRIEVKALAYMSYTGKLRKLEELLIKFACAEDHPRFLNFKGYDAGSDETLVCPVYKAILDKCHKMVDYEYVFF